MTKTDPYSLRHQAQRSASDADQAEFFAMKNGTIVVDVGVYDERVAGAMDDFEAHDTSVKEIWHEEDLKYDTAVGQTHEEIERRVAILGGAYPFSLRDGTLSYEPSPTKIYEFFLSICNAKSITAGKFVGLPRIFERVSAKLVAAYFGAHTQSIHTGFPRDAGVGASFKNAMSFVSQCTNEWTWGPDDELPGEPVHGDAGCDFVVWPETLDGRKIGQLFVLGQCACGNDWVTKFNDLSLKKLQKWFNPLCLVDPVRTFTTPFHVTDAMLKEASREAGLLFDRARLTLVADRFGTGTLGKDIPPQIGELIDLVTA